jgi:hypothetical protein
VDPSWNAFFGYLDVSSPQYSAGRLPFRSGAVHESDQETRDRAAANADPAMLHHREFISIPSPHHFPNHRKNQQYAGALCLHSFVLVIILTIDALYQKG